MKVLPGERNDPPKTLHANRGGHGGGGSAKEMTPADYAALEPEKVLMTMRIIAGALMTGVVLFAGIATMVLLNPPVGQGQQPGQVDPTPMIYFGIGGAVLAVVLRFVLPSMIARSMVAGIAKMAKDGTSTGSKELFGRLLTVAQTKMIIEDAFLEGACFFNLIVVMTSRSPIPAGVVGGLFILLAANFPTMFKLGRWLDDQRHALS